MIIRVDLSTVPPAVSLEGPADFSRFHVRAVLGEEALVDPEAVRALGASVGDADWVDGFDSMLAAAAEHGWIVDGMVRAHVETAEGPEAP